MKTIKEFFTRIQWNQVDPAVIVRYIIGILSVVNSGLIAAGKPPINLGDQTANTIYTVVSIILSIVMIIVNTYQNNSTSKEAIYADLILNTLESFDKESDRTDIMDKLSAVLNDVKESTEPKEQKVDVPKVTENTTTVSDENTSTDNTPSEE